MSKSKGNTVYADDLISYFGVDAVRYYLISQMPYVQDGSITYENFIKVYNSDLANTFGNLVSRTVAMNKKYFASVVPTRCEMTELDEELVSACKKAVCETKTLMEEFRASEAVERVFELLKRANKYIDETMPWALAKDENQKACLSTVIYNLLEVIRVSTVLLSPVIPFSCEKIKKAFTDTSFDWESVSDFGFLACGTAIEDTGILFSRIDEEEMLKKIYSDNDAKSSKNEKNTNVVTADEITIEQFSQVCLKCAEVVSCEKVEKSKKLLKLQLNLGDETRQVVSGIAESYSCEDMIGKKVILVSNLKPAKLMGIESFGMILASKNSDGSLRVVFLDKETENGAVIR